jgi:predicted DNA-binding protein
LTRDQISKECQRRKNPNWNCHSPYGQDPEGNIFQPRALIGLFDDPEANGIDSISPSSSQPNFFLAFKVVYVYNDTPTTEEGFPCKLTPGSSFESNTSFPKATSSKLERLAKHKRTSATAIVREAINAYNPEGFDTLNNNVLMALVSARIKEAIQDIWTTRKKLNETLKELGTV